MKYMLKMLSKLSFKKFKNAINEVHKKSSKSKIFIFFDMIYCFLKYQAGYFDYVFFEMYKLDRSERKTILTRGKNNTYIKKLNPKEYWNVIDDKGLFNEKFKKYINRDYIVINEKSYNEFEKFIEKKKEIIVKPLDKTGGAGIEKIKITKENHKKIFDKLIENKQFLIEEVLKQHKDMSALHPSSINTIRIVTINNKYNVTSVVAAILRIGTEGRVVDNFHSGGLSAPLDIKTGIINGKAVSRDGKFYTTHPTTNIKLIGYQMPNWNEVIKLVKSAAKEIPELGLIGWDVCISPNKPCLIEANQYPGYDLYKMIKIPNSVGIIPVFEEALNKRTE